MSASPQVNLRCLACGSSATSLWATGWDAEYFATNDRFSYHRCLSCGVLFINPVPSNRLKQIYPPNYYSFSPSKQSVVHKVKRWLDGKIFKSNLRGVPGTRLCALDVGGGSGWELIFIREADARIKFTQVVDIDPHVADLARGNGHEFFCGRIEDFCSDRKFDFILLLNLIEHVEDPYAVLSKIRNMLSPKGVVLVKTPNYDSLDARIFRHANWGGYHCPRHWVLFTKESFSQIATRAGLRVRQFTYTQGAPFWTTSILFWLAERGLISITKEKPAVYHPLFPVLAGVSAAFDFARKPFAKTSQMFFVLVRDDYYSGSQLNES